MTMSDTLRTNMHHCPECGWPYTSELAATECADMDQADQQRQRAWTKAHTQPVKQITDFRYCDPEPHVYTVDG